jgi:hypothetical protein
VVKYRGIEFRLGNGKACQSIIPPSAVDGVAREWTYDLADHEPQSLPDSVIEAILAESEKPTAEFSGNDPLLAKRFA